MSSSTHASDAPFIPMLIGNVLVNALLLSVLVTVMFFTYVSKVEQGVVRDQADIIARALADDISLWIPSSTAHALADGIKVDDPNADNDTLEHNAVMKKKAYSTLGMVVGIVAVVLIPFFIYLPWEQLVFPNILLAGFIALTEFAFLNLVTKNYIVADPNYVRSLIVNQILNKLAKSA